MTLEEAITAILRDLIESSTGCGCCDNNQTHAELIKRALVRVDPEFWPEASIATGAPALMRLYCAVPYADIYDALRLRRITWA